MGYPSVYPTGVTIYDPSRAWSGFTIFQGKGLARQPAYELVQRSALRATAGESDFRGLLGRDPEVTARLTPAEIDRAFDLQHHLRHVGTIIDRALKEETA